MMTIALLNCGLLRPKHQRKAVQKVGYAIPWFDLPLKQTHIDMFHLTWMEAYYWRTNTEPDTDLCQTLDCMIGRNSPGVMRKRLQSFLLNRSVLVHDEC